MLAVGVDAAAERVAVLLRVAVAGGDPGREATVPPERDHLGAVGLRDGSGRVGGAVVDDEQIGLGKPRSQLLEHRGQVLLLVPGREEDESVGMRADARRLASAAMERFTTRPELRGTLGMVASTHWLASAAGMAMLERGGNAFDAAGAAGFVLQVVQPQ